jgi:hypothetical protein
MPWYAGKGDIREYLEGINKHSKVRRSAKIRKIEMPVLNDNV